MVVLEVFLSVTVTLVALSLLLVLGICSKKSKSADMVINSPTIPPGLSVNGNMPMGNNQMMNPEYNPNALFGAPDLPMTNYEFDLEGAPDAMRNNTGFDPKSVNFSNFQDMRGDKKNNNVVNNMGLNANPMMAMQQQQQQQQQEEEEGSEYDSEYDSESEDGPEEMTGGVPMPLPRVTIAGRPEVPVPTVGRTSMNMKGPQRDDLKKDFEAGIQVMAAAPMATARPVSANLPMPNGFMQNLSFNRQADDGYSGDVSVKAKVEQAAGFEVLNPTAVGGAAQLKGRASVKKKIKKKKRRRVKKVDERGVSVKVNKRRSQAPDANGNLTDIKRKRPKSKNPGSNSVAPSTTFGNFGDMRDMV